MGEITIERDTYTERKVIFRERKVIGADAEVWCPYRDRDVDIFGAEGCLPADQSGSCAYLSTVTVGAVVCGWTEIDGCAAQ